VAGNQTQATTDSDSPDYTYIEDDHTLYYPVSSGPIPDLATTIYDSIHYYVDPSDNMSKAAVEGDAEWDFIDASIRTASDSKIKSRHHHTTHLWHVGLSSGSIPENISAINHENLSQNHEDTRSNGR